MCFTPYRFIWDGVRRQQYGMLLFSRWDHEYAMLMWFDTEQEAFVQARQWAEQFRTELLALPM